MACRLLAPKSVRSDERTGGFMWLAASIGSSVHRQQQQYVARSQHRAAASAAAVAAAAAVATAAVVVVAVVAAKVPSSVSLNSIK